jgi:putative MATE family efflux protein
VKRAVVDRDIFRLAFPALGALVAEPLFLLTDTAMVGHLGQLPLAGLGLAGTILQTIVGLLIFLAYATTPFVARRLGAGDRRGAMSAGIDGLWLAIALGVLMAAGGILSGPTIVSWFGAGVDVTDLAAAYLHVSWWGLPGMLLVLAATGVLRGLQDTVTPFVVAVVGFSANILLNAVFIYGLGWGLVGSAVGTVIAQWGMALWLVAIVVKLSIAEGVPLLPGRAGVLGAMKLGGWLFIRTISLRVAFVGATVVATNLGTAELASWHVAFTIFSLIALALDSLAIAGQSLVGLQLGQGDKAETRAIVNRLIFWGWLSGGVLGVVLIVSSSLLPFLVTSDEVVRALLVPTLIVLGLAMPLGGFVFVLDGVLMGAGDGRYLAVTGVLNVAVLLPLFALTLWLSDAVSLDWSGIVALQASVGFGYLGARALTLGLRAKTDRWMVTGVDNRGH